MVQTKRHQATFNEAVDTERDNRVLVSSPLGERLDGSTDRRPDKGQDHARENRCQTGDNWHKTLARKEAQIFRQLDAIEAVEHVRCDGTRDDTAEYAGICKVFSRNLFSR